MTPFPWGRRTARWGGGAATTPIRQIRSRGQTLTEFALIAPLMLGLLGAGTDLARLYGVWVNLEAATRDAAEYVATNDTTSSGAATDAQKVVCTELGRAATCTDPTVSVTSFT